MAVAIKEQQGASADYLLIAIAIAIAIILTSCFEIVKRFTTHLSLKSKSLCEAQRKRKYGDMVPSPLTSAQYPVSCVHRSSQSSPPGGF